MDQFFTIIFLEYVLVGFIAQTIDGALGMAYGVSCTSFLLGLGIPPLIASASVKLAETFTTLVSGISHFRLGNVDNELFIKLLVPGIFGGILGAYFLSNFSGEKLKPFISAYLLIMGLRILYKAIRLVHSDKIKKIGKEIYPLGFVGGLMDAIGGGGWGPIVTSTLIGKGNSARMTIGSVNASEFFVTISQVITFSLFLKLTSWDVVIGLMVGGLFAAPFSAVVTKKLSSKKLMIIVGLLIILLSIRTIYLSIF